VVQILMKLMMKAALLCTLQVGESSCGTSGDAV
jgi:hypothetical protein